MANLESWQKITYVLKGMPYGDSADGDATVSSDPHTRTTFTGTDTEMTGTAGAGTLADGDIVKIIQNYGTGHGNWQYNKIVSGGGTTSLTFLRPLHYTFGSGAQIYKIPRYHNLTVNATTITAWNGSIGGDATFLARSITVSGQLSAVGKGLRGGNGAPADTNQYGNYGESTTAATGNSGNINKNTCGGGGGQNPSNTINGTGGGGGGHVTAGGDGASPPDGFSGGQGGALIADSADLVTMDFGGSGGGGSGAHSNDTGIYPHRAGGNGGAGGGNITLIAKTITLNSYVTVAGAVGGDGQLTYSQPGYNGMSGCGGGGAGGSLLMMCDTANIGTNYLLATGGLRGASNGGGTGSSQGSVGRIAIHHLGTITGSSSPSYTDVVDHSLKEQLSSATFLF